MSAQVLNAISFKRESVWGTPVVPDKSLPVHFTGGIQTQNDIQMLSSLFSRLAKNHCAIIGNRTHEGTYEMDLFSDYPGYFLLSALGDVVSTLAAGETIVYDHAFTEVEDKPSMTIEQAVGDNVRRYAGVINQNFKVSGEVGKQVMASVTLKGKSQATSTAITPVYADECPFDYSQVILKIGGTQYDQVQTFEIEFTNNIEFLHALNSNDPQFKYVKGSEVKGKIELYLDSATLTEYNNYINKTIRSIELEIVGEAIGVAENKKFSIDIPTAVLITAETPINEDYNLLSIEFEGIYDTVTGKLISASITNLLPNYN